MLYDEAQEQLRRAETQEERDFLAAASEGLLCMKAISEKFSEAAIERLKAASDPDEIFLCQVGTKKIFENLQAVHRRTTTRERLACELNS